ncbi:MAG: hypothetical protein OXH79_11150 [Boseongicola sp.]|nr:hypothetical protein [Boseongicola sp.]
MPDATDREGPEHASDSRDRFRALDDRWCRVPDRHTRRKRDSPPWAGSDSWHDGFLISLPVTGFEQRSRHAAARNRLGRAPFLFNVIPWSVICLAVFALVIQSSLLDMGVESAGRGWREPSLLIAVGASFAANVAVGANVRIDRVPGRGVLVKSLTGQHHWLREEGRTFPFIDLVGSTATAECIDQVAFHRPMNDSFACWG